MKFLVSLLAAGFLMQPTKAISQIPQGADRVTANVTASKEKAIEKVVLAFIDAGLSVDRSEGGLVVSTPYKERGPFSTFVIRANIVGTDSSHSLVILTATYTFDSAGLPGRRTVDEGRKLVKPAEGDGPGWFAWLRMEKIARSLQ